MEWPDPYLLPSIKVRELVERGMTQAEIAEAIGCSTSTVSRWAHGSVVPSPLYGIRLARLHEGKGPVSRETDR